MRDVLSWVWPERNSLCNKVIGNRLLLTAALLEVGGGGNEYLEG